MVSQTELTRQASGSAREVAPSRKSVTKHISIHLIHESYPFRFKPAVHDSDAKSDIESANTHLVASFLATRRKAETVKLRDPLRNKAAVHVHLRELKCAHGAALGCLTFPFTTLEMFQCRI